MKHVILMPNAYKDREYRMTKEIIGLLREYGAILYLHEDFRSEISYPFIHYYCSDLPKEGEFILVLGGDGSFLDAAKQSLSVGLPIIGVNLGRLGYLTELEANEVSSLSAIFSDSYAIKEHMALDVTLLRPSGESVLLGHAVNDVVIGHSLTSGMVDLELCDGVGNSLLYKADGLIVSTPLGSTAYSLSAGGPVIDSSLEAVCVTPVCAHSFFGRSILFSPDAPVSVKNLSRREETLSVSLDGAEGSPLLPGEAVKVSRSSCRLKILTVSGRSLLSVLRKKMQLLNFQ